MNSQFVDDSQTSRVLVVGSGIAGLQFALLAAERGSVWVVTKKESRESNTNYAQGGIAAAVSPLDDFELHVQDTLEAGDGLCHEQIVRRMVEAGPHLIDRLLSYGVAFSPAEEGTPEKFALGREGGHSRRRVLHCSDLTGREIEKRLLRRLTRRGPECLSKLAIELTVPNRRLLEILQRLEGRGLVLRRPHRFTDCGYGEDEDRWGLAGTVISSPA